MTCNNKEMENKISMYLDKDLPESEVKALEEHIQSCDTCKALYEDLKLMNEIMSDMPVMDLPEDFESELHDKLVKVSTKSTADEMASDNGINLDVDTNNNKQDNDSFERKVIRIPLPSFKDFKRHSKPLTALAATVMIAVLPTAQGMLSTIYQRVWTQRPMNLLWKKLSQRRCSQKRLHQWRQLVRLPSMKAFQQMWQKMVQIMASK